MPPHSPTPRARSSDFSAGASPSHPGGPGPSPRRGRRVLRALGWLLVAMIALLIAAAAAVWWWAGSSTSLAAALALTPSIHVGATFSFGESE